MNTCTTGSRALFVYCKHIFCGVDCIAIGVGHPKLREQAMQLVDEYYPTRGVLVS